MSELKQPILDAEPVEESSDGKQTDKGTAKKKFNFKFHLILMLVLGAMTWAFITYSATFKGWQQAWYDFTHQPTETIPSQQVQIWSPDTPAPTSEPNQIVEEPTSEDMSETMPEDTPIFVEATLPEVIEPIPSINETDGITDTELTANVSIMLEDMQQQLIQMQDNINQMFAQQFEQNKQRISAQMYNILQQAASQTNGISSAAAAWKSIGLLPMLDESRRTQAEQAWLDLNQLNQDTQALQEELISHIQTLAEKLRPEARVEVAENIESITTESDNADTWQSSLDWLKSQFQLHKVEQHALNLTQDPYEDLKNLIQQLDHLEKSLKQGYWNNLPDIDTLVYQLEQYGITTSLSADLLNEIQQTQQSWQQQAQAWMEQL